jgi:hypothetical protein
MGATIDAELAADRPDRRDALAQRMGLSDAAGTTGQSPAIPFGPSIMLVGRGRRLAQSTVQIGLASWWYRN